MNYKKTIFSVFTFLVAFACQAQTLKDAIRLTDNEQYDAAAVAFKALIASEPVNGTNYYFLGENYLLSEEADSAAMMYAKGKAVDPNNVLNEIGQAKYKLNAAGDSKTIIAEAGAIIDQAILKAGPKNAQVLVEGADALIRFKNKNLEKAKQLLDKAFALDPKNPEIQILYGDIYSEQNFGTLAAECYNKALELDKNSVKSIVKKGKLYKRSTNYDGAAEEFQKAIKIDSSFAPAHRELGEIYFKQGKLEKAKEEFRKYLELSKNNMSARIRLATIFYLGKDYNGALNEINQLSKTDENNMTLLRLSAYCYYETKEYAKGLSAIQKLFSKLVPEKVVAIDYEYYGKLLVANDQDSLGIIQLRKAYELDSNRCDLLSEIWKAYDKMKKYGDAAATLQEKVQRCKGATATDYFNLGRAYFFNSEFILADSSFVRVCELLPKWPSGFLWKADNYANIDSTSQTYVSNYEKFIEIATQDTAYIARPLNRAKVISSYKRITSYYFKKVPDETIIGYLKKILELDPEDEYAITNLKGYEQQKKKNKN